MLVGPLVAHHADCAYGQQHGKGLPDVAVEPRRPDLLIDDRLRAPQDGQALARHRPQHPDGQPWPRKGLPPNDLIRQAQFFPEHAHFIFEQLAQRLDQAQFHLRGQPAHVVMGLDRGGGALEADAFDHVGIERALGEEGSAAHFLGFRLEDVDEEAADGLALLLGVGNAGERPQELARGVDMDERDVVGLAEQAHDLVGLALAHEAVVDENAGELLADRLMDEDGGDRRVDAAREAADHPLEAHLLLDPVDHLGLE